MRFVRRHESWTAKCVALRAEQKAGVNRGPAYIAWCKGGRPSKVAKHRAYDSAAIVARSIGAPLPSTVEEIKAVCKAVR